MSGIAVVANADGRPIDRELLAAMADALKARGPDGQSVWTDDDPLGLVHSLLQTTEDDLPAGHRLEWTPLGLKIERYWSASIPEEVWLRHPQDYIKRFNEVFERAVADRLRTQRVSIAMSGGLDSTSIAATAVRWARKHEPDTEFRSLTYAVHDGLNVAALKFAAAVR